MYSRSFFFPIKMPANNIDKWQCLDGKETIDFLIKTKKSFIRWGDGETKLLAGANLFFQAYTKKLSNSMMNEILIPANKGDFLLGLPFTLMSKDYMKYSEGVYLKTLLTYHLMNSYLSKTNKYGDAHLFRPLSTLEASDVSVLWDGLNVIVVSSDSDAKKIIGNISKPLAVEQLTCEPKDSFERLDDLFDNLIAMLIKYDKKMTRILISAGPGGKVLASRMVRKGWIVYDVGHFFKWKGRGLTNSKSI